MAGAQSIVIDSWNIHALAECWRVIAELDADFALVQEAGRPPTDVTVEVDDGPWETAGVDVQRPWRTAVVRVSDRFETRWRACAPLPSAAWGCLAVSRPGTMAVAEVKPPGEEAITLVSVYVAWEKPDQETNSSWIVADASAHRLVSDIALLIGQQSKHRIIVAGDWNLLLGYGENGSTYWRDRYSTVFDRMAALGLRFCGPQAPNGSKVPDHHWPKELPRDSLNVPTYRTRKDDPASATRQLDYVFASESIADRVSTCALNGAEQWGPSDHCRVRIQVSL